jgi:hypothetical protein
MTAEADIHFEVQGVEIVVTLPGTNYAVTYYRASAFPPTRAERTTVPQ